MSDAIAAGGTTLSRGAGLDLIAEISKIGGIEITLGTIDVTTLTSADDFREFIGGLFEAGEVPIEGNFIAGDTDGQVALMADQLAKTVQEFVITFPAEITATWSFDALVTKFKVGDYAVGGKLDFSATLKISGKPVLAIGTSDGLTTDFFTLSESAVISPDPANDVYDYIATVLTAIESVTVTPHGTGVLKVNGSVVATGEASTAITLGEAGTITDITITQTDTGKVAKTYKIKLFRAAS
jgi:hypothetical protein